MYMQCCSTITSPAQLWMTVTSKYVSRPNSLDVWCHQCEMYWNTADTSSAPHS